MSRIPKILWVFALAVAVASGCDSTDGATPVVDTAVGDATGDTTPELDVAVEVESGDADAGEVVEPVDTAQDTWVQQLGQACPAATRVGRFEALHDEYGAYVAGNVSDRIDALQVLVEQEKDGPCVLLQRKNPTCSPGCTKTEQCVRDAGCQPFPAPMDVGAVTVTGLVLPVTMTAKGANKDYFFTDFDTKAYEMGAHVELKAAGGDLKAFALHGVGVPDLVVSAVDWVMKKNTALTLTWEAAQGPWQVRISLNVDQHGLTPVTLVCDVPDTGSYTIPAGLTTALLNYGVSGAATASIERRTADSVELAPGCVDLLVTSRVRGELLAQ